MNLAKDHTDFKFVRNCILKYYIIKEGGTSTYSVPDIPFVREIRRFLVGK